MLDVDVEIDWNCNTDTILSKEPGQAAQQTSRARAKLDLNPNATRASVCTEKLRWLSRVSSWPFY